MHQTSGLNADDRAWTKILAGYRQPSVRRGVFELIVTIVPFAVLWALSWAAFESGQWWGLILSVPAALLLVRMFMIQHDCGHGSFLPTRRANDMLGRVIGILTLTPYAYWRRTHAAHHATSGNLDQRGMGDVTTLTVAEYHALSRWGRFCYRLYRHPAVMFGFGSAYLFLVQHRVPAGLMGAGWQPWVSAMGTNLAIAAAGGAMVWAVGLGPFLIVHMPIMLMAAATGVWLFYIQHQFEETFWESQPDWSFQRAALHGSSHYDLPPVLRWFTANIGVHHVHHLASRIPFYRLGDVLRDHPELKGLGRLTLIESLRCVRLVLWDEERKKLVSFRDVAGRQAAAAQGDHSQPPQPARRAVEAEAPSL